MNAAFFVHTFCLHTLLRRYGCYCYQYVRTNLQGCNCGLVSTKVLLLKMFSFRKNKKEYHYYSLVLDRMDEQREKLLGGLLSSETIYFKYGGKSCELAYKGILL